MTEFLKQIHNLWVSFTISGRLLMVIMRVGLEVRVTMLLLL